MHPTSGVESISTRGCSNILVLAASGRLNAIGKASGSPLLHKTHIHSLACRYMKNSHHHHAPSASSSSSSQSSSSPSSSSHGKTDLSRQRLHQPQRLDQPRQRLHQPRTTPRLQQPRRGAPRAPPERQPNVRIPRDVTSLEWRSGGMRRPVWTV